MIRSSVILCLLLGLIRLLSILCLLVSTWSPSSIRILHAVLNRSYSSLIEKARHPRHDLILLQKFLPQDLALYDVCHCQTHVAAHLYKVIPCHLLLTLDISLLLEELLAIHRVESRLQSVAIENRELSEHDHSRSGLLLALIRKLTISEGKKLVLLTQHIGYQLY